MPPQARRKSFDYRPCVLCCALFDKRNLFFAENQLESEVANSKLSAPCTGSDRISFIIAVAMVPGLYMEKNGYVQSSETLAYNFILPHLLQIWYIKCNNIVTGNIIQIGYLPNKTIVIKYRFRHW